jgi:hypothetical protein
MGRVEVALERGGDGSERVVALKRLLPENARDPRRKEMFLREARLGALLTHPNVVRAYAFGELGGELFLAMEYVEGEPLSRVLAALKERHRRLDVRLTCHVLAEVCEGLHAAHELADADGKPLNVVHRDVSPQNVIVAYDGQVKLLDFGVAKLDTADHQTRTGEVKGKMAFMSPEQALGEELDRRSDLFSIGAVLFECVTGSPMWGAGSDVELMRKLALEQAPRLDPADGQTPAALATLHARLVAREPSKRPATAREVAAELRAARDDGMSPASQGGGRNLDGTSPASPGRGRNLKGAGKASEAALAVLMKELFGASAAERRALLAESLARAALSGIDDLRRTLEADDSRTGAAVSEPAPALSPPPRRAPRTALLVSVGLATVAATAVVGAGAMHAPAATTASAAATATAPESPPAPAPAPASALAPAPAPAHTSTSTTTTTTTTTSKPMTGAATATAPAARARSAPAAPVRPRPAALPKPAASKLPDVDPTPF